MAYVQRDGAAKIVGAYARAQPDIAEEWLDESNAELQAFRTPPPTPEETNRATIEQQAISALTANRSFVAIATPTNAQNAAQIKALSRQVNGLIRMVFARLDGTD